MWQKVKYTVAGLLALAVVIVTFQNTDQVEAKLLMTTVTLPIAFLLFATLLIGFILGVLATGIYFAKRKRR